MENIFVKEDVAAAWAKLRFLLLKIARIFQTLANFVTFYILNTVLNNERGKKQKKKKFVAHPLIVYTTVFMPLH